MSILIKRQESFRKYWECGYLTDVTLVCRNGSIHAHRLLLAAASDFWKRILVNESSTFDEDQCHKTVLLPDMDLITAEVALNFIYGGVVSFAHDKKNLLSSLKQLFPEFYFSFQFSSGGNVIEAYKDFDFEESMNQKENDDPNVVEAEAKAEAEEGEEEEEEEEVEKMQDYKAVPFNSKSSSSSFSNNKCEVCFKTFRYPKDLDKHGRTHTGEAPYGCSICKRYFRNKSNLYKHLRDFHKIIDNVKDHVIDINGRKEDNNIIKDLDVDNLIRNAKVVCQDDRGNNLYECDICKKVFLKKVLAGHVNIHAGKRPHPCPNCDKAFYSVPGLTKHVTLEHKAESKSVESDDYKCHVCNKSFHLKSNLYVHQRTTHNMKVGRETEYECRYCHERFSGKVELSKHKIKNHKGETGELCSICGKSFLTEEQLSRHESIHIERDRPLQCSFCPKTYFRRDILKQHEKLHTDPVVCDLCGKKFSHARQVESHKRHKHDEMSGKEFKCEICFKTFSKSALLTEHIQEHLKKTTLTTTTTMATSTTTSNSNSTSTSTATTYPCDTCGKVFALKNSLRIHAATHFEKFPLKCEICKRGFMTDSQLHKHIDTVHQVKPTELLECGHCKDTSIKNLYGLKRHLQKHKCPLVTLNESCDACMKDLETYNRLKGHIELNDKKRIHLCGICDKKFRTKQELVNHGVVHTGEKPYKCDLCFERFTQQSSLNQHIQRHQKGLVSNCFPCEMCDRVLKTLTALRAHRKSHHHHNQINNNNNKELVEDDIETFNQELVVPDLTTYRIQLIDSEVVNL